MRAGVRRLWIEVAPVVGPEVLFTGEIAAGTLFVAEEPGIITVECQIKTNKPNQQYVIHIAGS